ncbi:hypothetical protein OPV22_031703 [Ensete ventricosum]|uniref:Uncharacterized protein n=1 Tax=Ensete ventricosum TaxID=4639 RepID=A0AAV8PLD2_ENSVE|nr:hypothetical protein OPV22_031703 [Ensete ventricosum]
MARPRRAQQIWLRKLGGAKPAVSGDAGGIISAGRSKRTASQPAQTGERLKQLKEEENRKMFNKALAVEGQTSASTSISDDESDGESNDKGEGKRSKGSVQCCNTVDLSSYAILFDRHLLQVQLYRWWQALPQLRVTRLPRWRCHERVYPVYLTLFAPFSPFGRVYLAVFLCFNF